MLNSQTHLTLAAAVAAASLASVAARKGILNGLTDELKREIEKQSRDWAIIWRLCDERAAVRSNQDRFVVALVLQVSAVLLAFVIDAGAPSMAPQYGVIANALTVVAACVLLSVGVLIAVLVRHRHSVF